MSCHDGTLIRDFAMATTFWLSMGYNFGCMIASNTLCEPRGGFFRIKLLDEDIVDFEVLRDVAMATIFAFLCVWCTLAASDEYD